MHILADPLLFLYNNSISSGVFPKRWGKSFIVPVFKKELTDDISNYGPITRANLFVKVFDNLVSKEIYNYIYSYIVINQDGFMQRRSTVSNLLAISEYVVNVLSDEG